MIKKTTAKTAFSATSDPDGWFGCRYTINPYRGCEHRCIYCDSRSGCYGVEDFDRVVEAKVNLPEPLRRELAKKKKKEIMGFGAMSDPWTFAEREMKITLKCLEVLCEFSWPVHLTTKSDMCLRDINLLKEIDKRSYTNVVFTLTTADDAIAKKVEPFAPLPSKRLHAMEKMAKAGISTGTLMTPVLPYIEDNEENILKIIEGTKNAGGTFCIFYLGMTMRDRQRAYFYEKLDELFPGTRVKYEKRYGEDYGCSVPDHDRLYEFAKAECEKRNLIYRMKDFSYPYKNKAGVQTSFI